MAQMHDALRELREQRAARPFYTITESDIGKAYVRDDQGESWDLGSAIGHVQRIDVGKRAYRVPVNDPGSTATVVQVENDQQRDERLAKTAQPAYNQSRAKGDAQALGSLWRFIDTPAMRGEYATRLTDIITAEPDMAKRGELLAAFIGELG